MMRKNKTVPERWENYAAVGQRVRGTKFLPFKVPLKTELSRRRPELEGFSPDDLMEREPKLRAIIDLTDTDRYYDREAFTSKGVHYRKINLRGRVLPSHSKCFTFFDAVDEFLSLFADDSDALIGVHCTHGLNRTGYLICKYMVARMEIDPQEAINRFEEARGYPMERKIFVDDIRQRGPVPDNHYSYNFPPEADDWRREPRSEPSGQSSQFRQNDRFRRHRQKNHTYYKYK